MMAFENFKEKISTYNFPRKLWMLASNKDIQSIRWAKGGTAITIDRKNIEQECFETGIFNVTKSTHLLRQLCYYNFKRDYTCKDFLLFSHPNFHEARDDLLPLVKRPLKSGRRKNIKSNMTNSVKRKKKLLLNNSESESNVVDMGDSNNKGSKRATGASKPERVKSFKKISKTLDIKKTHCNMIMPQERMKHQFIPGSTTLIADLEMNSQISDENLFSDVEMEPRSSKSAQYCGESLEVHSKKNDMHSEIEFFRKSSYVYTGPVWLQAEKCSDKHSCSKLADLDCEEESSSDTEQWPRNIADTKFQECLEFSFPFEGTFNSFSNIMWDGKSQESLPTTGAPRKYLHETLIWSDGVLHRIYDEMFIYPSKEETELNNRITWQEKKHLIELYKNQLKNGEISISDLLDSEDDTNQEVLYDILTSDITV